jgi:hypothetical protein
MPFHQEATFHDRQSMESTIPQSTASLVFVDVIGATITTKDLSQEGTYQIWTPVLVSASLNNTIASFRITIDDVQIGNVSEITLKVKELDTGYTFTGTLPGITEGQVMQLEYKTDKGTLTLQEFSIAVDGVPTSRVVI